jgi:hypothetical protein
VERVVDLRLQCGLVTEVISVAEDGVCQYVIEMATPAACSAAEKAAGARVRRPPPREEPPTEQEQQRQKQQLKRKQQGKGKGKGKSKRHGEL